MKYTDLTFGEHNIEFKNSFFGKETIQLDGRKVSEKYSITGTTHSFVVDHEDLQLVTSYRLFGDGNIKLELQLDRKTIHTTYFPMNSRHKVLWMGLGIALVMIIAKLLT